MISFIFLRVKESNNELEKERNSLTAEVAKLQLGGSEEIEKLRETNKELEEKLCDQSKELDETKEKLQAHDQAAKRAIAALQKEMALRVDQVRKDIVLALCLIASFRFEDKDVYEYAIVSILSSARAEPASFWQENMIVVVILQRVLARMS